MKSSHVYTTLWKWETIGAKISTWNSGFACHCHLDMFVANFSCISFIFRKINKDDYVTTLPSQYMSTCMNHYGNLSQVMTTFHHKKRDKHVTTFHPSTIVEACTCMSQSKYQVFYHNTTKISMSQHFHLGICLSLSYLSITTWLVSHLKRKKISSKTQHLHLGICLSLSYCSIMTWLVCHLTRRQR